MIINKAGRVPAKQHTGRFNAPTFNEVVIMFGDQFYQQNIKITLRDNRVQTNMMFIVPNMLCNIPFFLGRRGWLSY